MPITEQHWVGFDPRRSYPPSEGCPFNPECWTLVWYEHWFFFANRFLSWHQVGVVFVNAWACFDEVGGLISPIPIHDPGGISISKNQTAPPWPLPTNDEHLALARLEVVQNSGREIVPGGTVQYGPAALKRIGTRTEPPLEPASQSFV